MVPTPSRSAWRPSVGLSSSRRTTSGVYVAWCSDHWRSVVWFSCCECFQCTKCDVKVQAIKKLVIAEPPRTLIVQLMRSRPGMFGKVNKVIHYETALSLKSFTVGTKPCEGGN